MALKAPLATRDDPTMILIADKKRRVVLPRPAEPGDAYECLATGDRLVLVRLKPVPAERPPRGIWC
jgi:hypothetical protein